MPMIGITCGAVIVAWNFPSDQPRPNAKRSLRTFCSPHDWSVFTVQSPACSMVGEPLRRGPYASVSQNMCSMICERFNPSSRIFAMAAESTRSAVWAERETSERAVSSRVARFMAR